VDKKFTPSMTDAQRHTLLTGWQRAVTASVAWAHS
jgi:glycerol kinase